MININKILVIVGVVVMSGCASLESIESVEINNLKEDQAVIILSTGSLIACKFNTAQIVVKDSNKNPALLSSIGVYQLNNAYIHSHFETEYGLVFSTVLKPGTYDFWLSNSNPFVSYNAPMLTKPITLKPKEVRYVGEFYSDNCGGNGDMNVKVNDRSERDLNLIKTRKEDLSLEKVVVEPAEILPRVERDNT